MWVDQQRYYGGDIPAFSPSLKGEAAHSGVVWADAGTIIPWNINANYVDIQLLKNNYPMRRDYVEYLITADQAAGGTDDAFIQGVYYMNSVRLTALTAEVIGKRQDADKYSALAEDFYRITCGFTGAPLMLPVLLNNGLTDVEPPLLHENTRNIWKYLSCFFCFPLDEQR